jgi:UPF0042 nucleotide-binding protein
MTGPGELTDSHHGDAAAGIDVVLVTGLSGAGRGTAAKVLEDLGWYVADNPAGRGDGRALTGFHRRPR